MAVDPPYRIKNMVPGMIMLWFGFLDNIPSGWHICDGTLGTPDLRNRFVVGAGDTYAVGDNAAAPTHVHTFTGDGHVHEIWGGDPISLWPGYHWITNSSPATGTTDPETPLPPYKALCYMMKVA